MSDAIDLLICGAGPVGCVLAERAANVLGWRVLIVDRRSHIAGNCFDSHHESGVLIHNYGPHYFRTNDESLIQYLSQFTQWISANYEVQSFVRGQLMTFPINLDTLEQFFGRKLDPQSAERLLHDLREPIEAPANSEEFVLSRVGRELYEAFYKGYTQKQWGKSASELDPSVCGRIPVRLNRDRRYVSHRYQMMPAGGFTAMFSRMIRHRLIRVRTNTDYAAIRERIRPRFATVYTGPIDAYFNHCFGSLPYRSLSFDFRTFETDLLQPCVQINYPNDFGYTRSVEIKHVTQQRIKRTTISYETPRATGDPFYPIPTTANRSLYERYRQLAEHETRHRRVWFCGRLAQYRYFNTDEVIQEALKCFQQIRQVATTPAVACNSQQLASS
jgi:UDP-galactopyranose mutase